VTRLYDPRPSRGTGTPETHPMPAVVATLIREHISTERVHVIVTGHYVNPRSGTDGAGVLVTSMPVVDALTALDAGNDIRNALAQLFESSLQWRRVDSVRVCE